MKTLTMTTFITTLSLPFAGAANADNLLSDGTFLNPIGDGACGTNNWCDWTSVGITNIGQSAASYGFPGNYASLPNTSTNGADLFQWISALEPGTYTLSFYAQDPS